LGERLLDCKIALGDFIDMSKLILKITVASAFIVGGLILSSPSSFGKTEYTKKEGKGCIYCHVAAGKKDLNDLGKCYAEHNHTLGRVVRSRLSSFGWLELTTASVLGDHRLVNHFELTVRKED
jgi:hypothetical protein